MSSAVLCYRPHEPLSWDQLPNTYSTWVRIMLQYNQILKTWKKKTKLWTCKVCQNSLHAQQLHFFRPELISHNVLDASWLPMQLFVVTLIVWALLSVRALDRAKAAGLYAQQSSNISLEDALSNIQQNSDSDQSDDEHAAASSRKKLKT